MKLISGSMALLISKICVIGQQQTQMCSLRHRCIRKKVTVWCGFHAGGVIGRYFFVDENDRHVTVSGERYLAMLEDYLWTELDELGIKDMWFQQDGATSHTARVTIDLLKGKFGERVISRNGPVKWLPRSCDPTPLDFFLLGHIKSLVYANKPATSKTTSNTKLPTFRSKCVPE